MMKTNIRVHFLVLMTGSLLLGVQIFPSCYAKGSYPTRARSANASSKRIVSKPATHKAVGAKAKNAKNTGCAVCSETSKAKGKTANSKTARNKKKINRCHPPGYVDPSVQKSLNSAFREMRRMGIQPRLTSTWRSSNEQEGLHKCSLSRRCRSKHPGLYKALPSGQSVHEAGMAVDIAGVATGPRGKKRLTSQGRKIVKVMEKHGFKWRYGLADPVHFEADPRKHGYKNLRQAIVRNQTRCSAQVASKKKGTNKTLKSTPSKNRTKGSLRASRQGVVTKRGLRAKS